LAAPAARSFFAVVVELSKQIDEAFGHGPRRPRHSTRKRLPIALSTELSPPRALPVPPDRALDVLSSSGLSLFLLQVGLLRSGGDTNCLVDRRNKCSEAGKVPLEPFLEIV
jgi:hypothetical protein